MLSNQLAAEFADIRASASCVNSSGVPGASRLKSAGPASAPPASAIRRKARVRRWIGSEGSTDPLILQGGVYRLVLSAEGALGEEFRLVARGQASGPVQTEIQGRDIGPPDVPTIQIQMSPANFGVWESMRREAYRSLSPLGIPTVLSSRKVAARFTVDGAVSQVAVWLAGQGAQGHAHPRGPSFTVRLRAGPLVRGFSRFKLYNIRTQTGLLDYVVASILEDEGVFVPRKLCP